MRPPRTSYARSGELNIAYQVVGDGDLDVVYIPGFVSHLDLAWEDPNRALAGRRWSSFGRLILFDKRGTGLSDRVVGVPTIEERMDDIRAVMDAAGSEQAALVGYSEGGPLAILFAATYPERVRALVLGSTCATPMPPDDLDDRLRILEETWGTGLTMQFFDEACDREWAARFERSAATPRAAAEILRLNVTIDVEAALPAVTCPTLVIHRAGDPVVPVAAGRALAAALPHARYVERPGDGHMPPTEREWDDEVGLVEEFLTGARRATEPDRVLATLLFTDIVSSTERAVAAGDARWRERLGRHRDQADRLVRQHRGVVVKDTGDGVLARFDGPARAVRCAAAIVERAEAEGLPIRAGLHAGEIELVGDDVAGIAVHLAKRVESAAAPGRVLVSQTVRDLVTGSGIAFADRGVQPLKGIEGEWRLYEVTAS
jgi:class 3 adenylate cyclase/dienelactone hydrolase